MKAIVRFVAQAVLFAEWVWRFRYLGVVLVGIGTGIYAGITGGPIHGFITGFLTVFLVIFWLAALTFLIKFQDWVNKKLSSWGTK